MASDRKSAAAFKIFVGNALGSGASSENSSPRMKILRRLLILFGGLFVLALILFALALTPAVQTWAVKRVLKGDPSLGVRVNRVAVGFQRIELADIVVTKPGVVLTLPAVTIELPLLAAARNDIRLHRLVAKGWTVDVTGVTPQTSATSLTLPASSSGKPPAAQAEGPRTDPSTDKPASFEGIFKLLELPFDVAVDSVELEGVLLFSAKPGVTSRAQVAVNGGGLAAGKEGRFNLVADAALPEGIAPVNKLAVRSSLALRMDTPRSFDRIVVTNDATASGPSLGEGARLRSEATAERAGATENYAVVVKSFAGTTEKTLAEIRIANPSATAPFTGSWKLDLRDGDVAAFALGHALPAFITGASGTFSTDRAFAEIQLTGKSDVTVDKLDAVQAGLNSLGAIRVVTDFDLVQRGATTRVTRFSTEISGASPVASVQVLQPFEVVAATGEIKAADAAADLLRFTLKGLPLAWARPFATGMEITGEDVKGEFVARALGNGFTLRSSAPLAVLNLSVAQAGQPMLRAVDCTVAFTADYSPAGWQADVSEIAARSGKSSLVTLSVRAGQSAGKAQPTKFTGRLQANLPGLVAQPVGAGTTALTQGMLEMDFSGSLADGLQQIASKLTVSGLATKDGPALPKISADLRADVHSDGRVEANAPFIFELAGRQSDFELIAALKPVGARYDIDAQLLSNVLLIDDLKGFASLAPPAAAPVGKKAPPTPAPKPAPKKDEPPAPGPPDQKPVWDAVTGQVKLALKKVIFAPNMPSVEVSSTVKITPEAVTLESLRAVLAEGGELKMDGTVKFKAGAAEPYDISAKMNAAGLDPAPYLRAASPDRPPTIEGKLDMDGTVSGTAASLDRAAERAAVNAQVVCRGGKFHGFDVSAGAVNFGKLQEGTSKLAGAVSLIGSALGKGDLARGADKVRAGSDSVKRLVNFNFDQLNLDLAQPAGGAPLEIKNFSLISPDIRLVGSGVIATAAGVPFYKRPLSMQTQMAVRGAQADDLRTLKLLKTQPDELGYTALLEDFPIEGTLAQMGTDALMRLIQSALKL